MTIAQERALTEGHPLRLGDAYPIGTGEGTLLATTSVVVPRRGSSPGLIQMDAQYAPLPRTQLSLSTIVSTEPGATDDPASGDVAVAARRAFGPESGALPLFSAQLAATFPTGVGSRSIDLELKGYASKEVVPGLLPMFLHLNASADIRTTERAADERLMRYHLAAGPSFTLPVLASVTPAADVFVDEAVKRGVSETIGVEAGARYRVSPHIAIHGALGSELAGAGERAGFYARVGLSFGFAGPAR